MRRPTLSRTGLDDVGGTLRSRYLILRCIVLDGQVAPQCFLVRPALGLVLPLCGVGLLVVAIRLPATVLTPTCLLALGLRLRHSAALLSSCVRHINFLLIYD